MSFTKLTRKAYEDSLDDWQGNSMEKCWEHVWIETPNEAKVIEYGRADPTRVLYADTVEEAELQLDIWHPIDAGGFLIKYYRRGRHNSEDALFVHDKPILFDLPLESDSEWEDFKKTLERLGKLLYFEQDETEPGRSILEGDVIVDQIDHTVEINAPRVQRIRSARKGAETRLSRMIPTGVWKAFIRNMRDQFIYKGPLYEMVGSITWVGKIHRDGLWKMIKLFQTINGDTYRGLSRYDEFLEAAKRCLPHLRKSVKYCNIEDDEYHLVRWIEEELAEMSHRVK